jgi:hypothetical protein
MGLAGGPTVPLRKQYSNDASVCLTKTQHALQFVPEGQGGGAYGKSKIVDKQAAEDEHFSYVTSCAYAKVANA